MDRSLLIVDDSARKADFLQSCIETHDDVEIRTARILRASSYHQAVGTFTPDVGGVLMDAYLSPNEDTAEGVDAIALFRTIELIQKRQKAFICLQTGHSLTSSRFKQCSEAALRAGADATLSMTSNPGINLVQALSDTLQKMKHFLSVKLVIQPDQPWMITAKRGLEFLEQQCTHGQRANIQFAALPEDGSQERLAKIASILKCKDIYPGKGNTLHIAPDIWPAVCAVLHTLLEICAMRGCEIFAGNQTLIVFPQNAPQMARHQIIEAETLCAGLSSLTEILRQRQQEQIPAAASMSA